MKKVIVLIVLAISFLPIGFSQTSEEWQKQMEDFQEKMQEMAEQLSKQFGGKQFNFHFDTTFVQPFDFKSFEGMEFPFDTTIVREFHWDGTGDMPIEIDTMFFRHFKNFNPEDFPNLNLDGEWSKGMNEMMQQLMQQLEGMEKDFNGYNFEFKDKEWKSQPEDKNNDQAQPAPKTAPQKKRKTTIM